MGSSSSEPSRDDMEVQKSSSSEEYSEEPCEAGDRQPMISEGSGGASGNNHRELGKFPIGTSVILTGLQRQGFNYHIGRVVAAQNKQGRIGVALHGTVWKDADSGPSRRRPSQKLDPDHVALKPENLRSIDVAAPMQTSIVGTIPQWAVLRLLGDHGLGLPGSVVDGIVECLLIQRVVAADVSVAGCSTTRSDFELDAVLDGRDDTWWISGPGSCHRGVGEEYLEFSFGSTPRRVSFCGMKVPPLPQGPLSVRDFHLLALRNDAVPRSSAPDSRPEFAEDAWVPASHSPMHTLDRGNLQEFAIVPPVDTRAIRLVCTKNASAASRRPGAMADCIGLFQVSFA